MLDLYRMPTDAPGYVAPSSGNNGVFRAQSLQTGIAAHFQNPRLLPLVQVHEFEALLFSDTAQLCNYYPDHDFGALLRSTSGLQPEEINHTAAGAPSRRIIAALPKFGKQKSTAGPLIAKAIGLAGIRAKCPHFSSWVDRLESIAADGVG